MSYCRWSSDKFQSDVYAYASMMGEYTIHIRGVHPVSVEHVPDYNAMEWLKEGNEYFADKHKEYMDAVKQIQYQPIGLPYDGETIRCANIEELFLKLEHLRALGYYVPMSALEMVEEEWKEY